MAKEAKGEWRLVLRVKAGCHGIEILDSDILPDDFKIIGYDY